LRRDELSNGARVTLAALEKAGATPFEQMSAPEARSAFDTGWADLQVPLSPDATEYLASLSFVGELGEMPALAWRGKGAPISGARILLFLHGGGLGGG
jgi:acetyl esterase